MASIAKFDQWQNSAGVNYGTVLQVVSAIKTNTATYNPGTGSWLDVDGLSVSITPKFSTSKFYITCQISATGSSDNYNAYLRLVRNGTVVGSGVNESGYNGGASAGTRSFNQYFTNTMPINFLDSPATSSVLTYKIQTNNGNTTFINRGPGGNNDGWAMVLSSTITVMEISA